MSHGMDPHNDTTRTTPPRSGRDGRRWTVHGILAKVGPQHDRCRRLLRGRNKAAARQLHGCCGRQLKGKDPLAAVAAAGVLPPRVQARRRFGRRDGTRVSPIAVVTVIVIVPVVVGTRAVLTGTTTAPATVIVRIVPGQRTRFARHDGRWFFRSSKKEQGPSSTANSPFSPMKVVGWGTRMDVPRNQTTHTSRCASSSRTKYSTSRVQNGTTHHN